MVSEPTGSVGDTQESIEIEPIEIEKHGYNPPPVDKVERPTPSPAPPPASPAPSWTPAPGERL